jgi:multiple sugar transport system permease protein
MSRLVTNSKIQYQKHSLQSRTMAKSASSTMLMILFAIYFLLPLYWLIIAATKNTSDLFNTAMLLPTGNLKFVENLQWLNSYSNGIYWRWAMNSAIYASITATLNTLISCMGGYALSKYGFK